MPISKVGGGWNNNGSCWMQVSDDGPHFPKGFLYVEKVVDEPCFSFGCLLSQTQDIYHSETCVPPQITQSVVIQTCIRVRC